MKPRTLKSTPSLLAFGSEGVIYIYIYTQIRKIVSKSVSLSIRVAMFYTLRLEIRSAPPLLLSSCKRPPVKMTRLVFHGQISSSLKPSHEYLCIGNNESEKGSWKRREKEEEEEEEEEGLAEGKQMERHSMK